MGRALQLPMYPGTTTSRYRRVTPPSLVEGRCRGRIMKRPPTPGSNSASSPDEFASDPRPEFGVCYRQLTKFGSSTKPEICTSNGEPNLVRPMVQVHRSGLRELGPLAFACIFMEMRFRLWKPRPPMPPFTVEAGGESFNSRHGSFHAHDKGQRFMSSYLLAGDLLSIVRRRYEKQYGRHH